MYKRQQYDIAWENPEMNRNVLTKKMENASGSDLFVLPETFNTGFSIKKELAETMHGKTIGWMKSLAKKLNAAIMGSLIIEENSHFYNRMVLVEESGGIQFYDKYHLFNYGSEGKYFTAGREVVIFNFNGFKIKPIICYDVRFPVTARNAEDYDLMICVANWPETRIEAWDTLLKARSIENQSYVIGVNRIGEDGNKLRYCGHTQVFDPTGKRVDVKENENTICASIEKNEILNTRKNFPFLEDRDSFTITT